jgi:hypothetical protein
VYRIVTTSSTSEGNIYDRMIFMYGVARTLACVVVINVVQNVVQNVVNVVNVVLRLQHFVQQTTTVYNISQHARKRKLSPYLETTVLVKHCPIS